MKTQNKREKHSSWTDAEWSEHKKAANESHWEGRKTWQDIDNVKDDGSLKTMIPPWRKNAMTPKDPWFKYGTAPPAWEGQDAASQWHEQVGYWQKNQSQSKWHQRTSNDSSHKWAGSQW